MQLRPNLNFDGRCEEAVGFYRAVLGAEVTFLLRFKDCPDADSRGLIPPEADNKIMHASLLIGDITVQASDGQCRGRPDFKGFSLSLTVPDHADAERLFESLADGGRVDMPFSKTFFSSGFGMVTDRFGVSWKVHVAT
jgi:PhnB protein